MFGPNGDDSRFQDLTEQVKGLTSLHRGGHGVLQRLSMRIIDFAAGFVSSEGTCITGSKVLHASMKMAATVPVKVAVEGVERQIVIKGSLDCGVYHKSRQDAHIFSHCTIGSVVLVVAMKGHLSIDDKCPQHAIAQAFAVLEHRRAKQGGFPDSTSCRTHFVAVTGQRFRFGYLESTPDGRLLPHVSRIISLNIRDSKDPIVQ